MILPGALASVSVRVEAGRITALDGARDGATVIDARGKILAPALIDIHGDAFERQLMPRPNVHFPIAAALLETDRQLAANGIATAYHALTLSWEPGLRSVAKARDVIEGLDALAPRLTVESRVQLRWETFAFEALPLIEQALAGPLKPSIAFNDHMSMAMRDFDIPIQDRLFEHSPDFRVCDPADPRFASRKSNAARAGMDPDAYLALMAQVWERRPQVQGVMAQVAGLGRAIGAPMLSHDDTHVETRDYYRALGAQITEFPMQVAVAEAARAAGDWIIFGSPNVVRGGSHIGSPGAADMIRAGLCDVIASDYYYPALLAAVATLHSEAVAPLPALWDLVSANPAAASGLTDRGRISPGLRADLVLLDWPEGELPSPCRTWVAGRTAFASDAPGRA